MDEGLVETAEATISAPETVYFNSDGSLAEGWQSTLPEGYRKEDSLSTVKDTKSLAKMFVDTKRMVGKDKIAVPTDASSETEWEAYYKAGGRPETVEDYNLKVPEGIPAEISELVFPKERISKWQERFFKGGTSKKAANQYIADFAQDVLLDFQNQKNAEEAEMAELKAGLSAEYGGAYDQKIHLGNQAIEEGTLGDLEFKNRLTQKFGNDPDFIRYSVNLGGKFAEGRSPSFSNIPTPSDLQTQINDLMTSPVLLDPKSTPAQRKVIMDKIMALRERMVTTKTTP